MISRITHSLIILVGLFSLGMVPVTSQDREPAGALVAEGQYFNVYADLPADASSIVSKINFEYLVFRDSLTKGAFDDQKQVLVKTLDALFLEVSDILDMHVYSFKGAIRVFPDRKTLAETIKKEYGQDFSDRSIYYPDKNTIYISLEDLTVGILGHEIARAIISNSFAVPPPGRIQEILCGYVEYSLLKSLNRNNLAAIP